MHNLNWLNERAKMELQNLFHVRFQYDCRWNRWKSFSNHTAATEKLAAKKKRADEQKWFVFYDFVYYANREFSFDTFISSTHRSSAQQYDFSTLIFQFPFDALILFFRLCSAAEMFWDCFYFSVAPLERNWSFFWWWMMITDATCVALLLNMFPDIKRMKKKKLQPKTNRNNARYAVRTKFITCVKS